MAGVLQHPPLVGVVEPDELEVAPVALVGRHPVGLPQPGGVLRQVRQRRVRRGGQRLAQQLPALLDGVGGHEVDAGELRVLLVVLLEAVARASRRPGRPSQVSRGGRGCGSWVSHISSPCAAGSACSSRCIIVVPLRWMPVTNTGRSIATSAWRGVLGEAGLRHQPRGQRPAQERADHRVAHAGQARGVLVGVQQHLQRLEVLRTAEVVEPGHARRGGVEVLQAADRVPLPDGRGRSPVELPAARVQADAGDRRGQRRGQQQRGVGDLLGAWRAA